MSDATPSSYDLGDTFGALEIGVMISMFLFGAVTVQTYNYYGLFPEDSKGLKSMVSLALCTSPDFDMNSSTAN